MPARSPTAVGSSYSSSWLRSFASGIARYTSPTSGTRCTSITTSTRTAFRPELLNPERIPLREAAERAPALPTGSFVRVHTETAAGDLLGEVIYKEGAHPSLDGGFLDGALSGAPAAPDDNGGVVVRERFVLDLDAFGKDGNSFTPKQYERLCRKSRWLGANGHLVMDAEYTGGEADLEDIDFYVEYLLREHRDGMLAFCFSEEPSEDELREALLRSFESVRAIALRADDLRSWRDKYFFDAAAYRGRLAGDGVLAAGDLHTIYRGLTRVASGSRRAYAAVGPRILSLLEHGGVQPEEERMVRGCAYATAVCHTNVFVADTLNRTQRAGVLGDGVHVRLDDGWQTGGIWRSERVDDPERYSLASVPATMPLGLGYAETRPDMPAEERFADGEEPIASSQTGFTVVLTLRDRALGRLRLPASAVEALAPGQLDTYVVHDGERQQVSDATREVTAVYGIEWPWSCHPGIVLNCNVERGGSVLRARTTALAEPVIGADGSALRFETNLRVYDAATGAGSLPAVEKRGAPSLTELVNRAFRRYGRERDDGTRALTISELATAVLGPHWQPGETRVLAAALVQMRLERDGIDYLWRPRVTGSTRVADRTLLTAYGEGKPSGRLARIVHRHWVPMHLRLLADWMYEASAEKRRTYADMRRRHGMHGVLPDELPANYTWVEPHSRGSEGEEPEGAQLELIDESVEAVVDGDVLVA